MLSHLQVKALKMYEHLSLQNGLDLKPYITLGCLHLMNKSQPTYVINVFHRKI
jgi:hypothetical protein